MRNISRSLLALSMVATPALAQQVSNDSQVSTTKTAPAAGAKQLSVGARIGMVNVSGVQSGMLSYGLGGDYTVDERIMLGATIDYWDLSTGEISKNSVSINDVAVGANGKFIFTSVSSAFKPFVLAGVSVHRISISEGRADENGSTALTSYRQNNNEVSAKVAFDVGAGVVYTFQPRMDFNSTLLYRQLASAKTGFDQLGLSAGLAYRL